MAFDQATRNRLQCFVNDARRVLEEEFTRQLQNDYGMDPKTGSVKDLSSLRHINDAQRETARILRDTLAHYTAGGDMNASQGLDRILREQAFTVLNRLAALRMSEARGLLVESVGNGFQAKGFQLYARLAGTGLGETGDAYRVYLFSVSDELAQDLPGLFDRYSPQGRLFPREAALLQVLNLINDADISPLWSEDETIGWIYQYFNSKKEREAMREASQAPRNSRELAVRNQFFTPRYVVEFLVDNTLGRLWFNATGGATGLRERCQYLLVKPDETSQAATKLRDPRSLKLLDPACGSMHFGLYAFDLFAEIYREAWAWEQQHGPGSLDVSTQPQVALKPLSQTYEDEAAFFRDVPRLIVEHNIYGVDIDPRAAQIASLALWLRAQRAWHDAGVKAKDRPLIGRGHVVAPIAPPAERDLRQQFAANLDQRDAELFEKTLQLLKGLPELGVLLQVERELPRLIRQVYEGKGTGLFAAQELEEWAEAKKRLLQLLTEFVHTTNTSYQSRLFAEDAQEVFRFIELLNQQYDCIVMNPPFGDRTETSANYIDKNYPHAKADLGACFVTSSARLLRPSGKMGAITNRTMLAVQRFEKWRLEVTERFGLFNLVDLGHGVLDAMVETAMYVCGGTTSQRGKNSDRTSIINLLESSTKEVDLALAMRALSEIQWIDTSEFLHVPGAPWAHWVPPSILRRFEPQTSFTGMGGVIAQGPASADDFRFYRLRWEVPLAQIHFTPHIEDQQFAGHRWSPVTKGGEYSLWWDDIHLVVNWARDGEELKAYILSQYPYLNGNWGWVAKNTDKLFRSGGSYPYRTTSAFGMRYLPPGVSFSVGGWAVFPPDGWSHEQMLAVFNSRIARYAMEVLLGQGDSSESGTAARNHVGAAVGGIPWPARPPISIEGAVRSLADQTALFTLDETALFFSGRDFFNPNSTSFGQILDQWWEAQCDAWERTVDNYLNIESSVISAYALTDAELEQIDQSEGPSLGSYPEASVDLSIVGKWFNLSVIELTKLAKQACGSKRYVVKKAYFVDRVIDLMCHVLKVHPYSIIRSARAAGPVACGFEKTFSRALVGWLVGVGFGRFAPNRPSVSQHLTALQSLPASAFTGDSAVRILVDDDGHLLDIGSRFQQSLLDIWPEGSSQIEGELCPALDVSNIKEYIRNPFGFFSDHLGKYSKSRRRAPIYWPLSTTYGTYTLWVYYPNLTSETLYTAINNFVEPKLQQVSADVAALRSEGAARTRENEKQFESLQAFELELIELRDTLLKLAPTYKPSLDDGVEISAAPLWALFRHRPWQNVLKDTWAKLEKGDYDWAHLAMNYWPERVREKCKSDKSLAIAHGLEHLYVAPDAQPKKTRGRKKAGDD